METVTTLFKHDVEHAVSIGPAVTIILPFEPKMCRSAVLTENIHQAVEAVEMELLQNHCDDMGMLVIQKLKTLIQNLNYNTYNKSIALFVSPVFEKVLYLDFDVDTRISIAPNFKIRDIVKTRKAPHEFLVLFIGNKESHIYQGRGTSFTRILSNTPEAQYAGYDQLYPSLVNPDEAIRKEQRLKVCLHHTDQALHTIVQAYQMPLLVVGPAHTLQLFRKITRHAALVVDYLELEADEIMSVKLRMAIEPAISDWEAMRHKFILNRLNIAERNDRVAKGMTNVREKVMKGKGSLLVIEDNFPAPADSGNGDAALYQAIGHYSKYSYVQDAVDELIEKLLERGAEVQFVKEGLLIESGRIALVY